jgi:hypothetical protein
MENDDGQIYDCITPEEHAREEGQYTVALYRGREWAGLTDEEIWASDEIMEANSGYGANFETLRKLTKAIEAKLKAKNFA